MDDFDPYKFDTPDTYALKTGDPSTGGLEDPPKGALPIAPALTSQMEVQVLALRRRL